MLRKLDSLFVATTLIGVANGMQTYDSLYLELDNLFQRACVHDIKIEKSRALTEKGEYICVSFQDSANKPLKVMFCWEDYKMLLDEQSYRQAVSTIMADIESELMSAGLMPVADMVH